MSAYLVGHINVKDEKLWQAYVQGVKESLEGFHANIMMRGKKNSVLTGENPSTLIVMISFKDHDELQAWYHSEQYQAITELREKAAEVVITTYEEHE